MTNTILQESGVFKNADGLRVKYGLAEARKGLAGTVANKDDDRILYYDIDWTRLPAHQSAATTGYMYGSSLEDALPTGAIITSAVLETTTVFAGTGATITLGFVDKDGQETGGGDLDGLWSALAITDLEAVGDIDTSTGDQINAAATTAPLYLYATVGTADLTAGAARLKVVYNIPRSAL